MSKCNSTQIYKLTKGYFPSFHFSYISKCLFNLSAFVHEYLYNDNKDNNNEDNDNKNDNKNNEDNDIAGNNSDSTIKQRQ